MSRYWQLLLVFACALAGAIAWQALSQDPGYVLVTFRGWSLETTLLVAALLLALALWAVWLGWRLLRTPFRFWRRRRRRIGRERLAGGLEAMCEGHWAKADKLLQRAAHEPSLAPAALLMAAEIGLLRGDPSQADPLLDRARQAGADKASLVLTARRLLKSGRPGSASELLDAAAREAALSPAALELHARSLIACGRGSDALALLAPLQASKLYAAPRLLEVLAELAAAALQQARTAGELGTHWNGLPRALRQQARVVCAYARRADQLGDGESASAALESLLGKHWDESAAALYGQLEQPQPRQAIKQAERWLQAHPDSAGCLLALGELCRREQLWGKAEDFLQRALGGQAAAAWEALGRLYGDRNDHGRARQAFHNALRAQRGEATAPIRAVISQEAVAAIAEERTSMGLPRLPGTEA